ncbi:hypothetical protein [Streptomyces sp. NPDC052225]|uniref:hypothetical protein n=1 Tax=Streptomyces sp. NPDC052225 TaxID=3154949 RepID=UPI00343AD777
MGMVIISGCSNGKSDGVSGVSADKLCDESLDRESAAALEKISGTTKFQELPGKNDFGEPNKFSLARAGKHLSTETTQRTQCNVYKASDKSGHPLLQIDFIGVKRTPTRKGLEDATERTFYPVGSIAYAGDGNSTSLYFECREASKADGSKFIDAAMYSSANQMKVHSTENERMAILNSISRKFASQLGCLAEARLPKHLPKPSP